MLKRHISTEEHRGANLLAPHLHLHTLGEGRTRSRKAQKWQRQNKSPAGTWYKMLYRKSDGLAAWRGVAVVKCGHCQRSCGDTVTWTG